MARSVKSVRLLIPQDAASIVGSLPYLRLRCDSNAKIADREGKRLNVVFRMCCSLSCMLPVVFQPQTIMDKGVEKHLVVDIGSRPESGL